MKTRGIKKLFPAQEMLEGAGVVVKRSLSGASVAETDPFLMLDELGSDDVQKYEKGFPFHPHRGIQTVTYMKRGSVVHEDSLGNCGVIEDGDVQWMTAGSGIIHQEMPRPYKGTSQGFQLWINLPHEKKMTDPKYRGITKEHIPEIRTDDAVLRVIAGKYGDKTGPVTDSATPVAYFDVALQSEKTFSYDIQNTFNAILYVYEGTITIGDDKKEINARTAVLLTEGDNISVHAKEDAQFLLFAGEPLHEPIAWHGPIVMNTEMELLEALEAYRNGTFVKGRPS